MKKEIFLVLILVVLFGVSHRIETNYYIEGTIVRQEGNKNVVRDTTGNEWVFYQLGYGKGEKVRMRMFNNHTDGFIEDDEILKVFRMRF